MTALSPAAQVAYFRKAGRRGQARAIVEGMLRAGVAELPMEYPVTTEIPFDSPEYNDALARFYDDWADRLAAMPGEVVVLCEGDPFFYGSFMHLYARLKDRTEIEVIPGITGMAGCWHATGTPITWGDDVMSVLMGTLPEDDLVAHMQTADALVIIQCTEDGDNYRLGSGTKTAAGTVITAEHVIADMTSCDIFSEAPIKLLGTTSEFAQQGERDQAELTVTWTDDGNAGTVPVATVVERGTLDFGASLQGIDDIQLVGSLDSTMFDGFGLNQFGPDTVAFV